MAGFSSVKSFVDAQDDGKVTYTAFRKSPAVATTASVRFDLSMVPGNPVPQYYAASPLVSTVLSKSTDGGINHGLNVSSSTKHIKQALLMSTSATGLPMPFMLCDYLMFYSFCDTGTNDVQTLTNSSSITRYTDGAGVRIMAVSVAPNSGLSQPTFRVSYTNSSGVAGRTSATMTFNTATANGSIITNQTTSVVSTAPFIGLQAGDSGVRSIESVQVLTGSEVGLFALVLVKPILTGVLLEQTAPCELVPMTAQGMQAPRVYDDAYLNLICLPSGSLSGVSLHGELQTVWN